MAILMDTSTGSSHSLRAYHVFGRSSLHADSVLTDNRVSLIHAVARWDTDRWMLIDHSRNGLFLNLLRLSKDRPAAMQMGDEIRFGTPEAPPWQVVDLSAPASQLQPVSPGLQVVMLEDFQVLPNQMAPHTCLFRAANGQWMQETSDGTVPLNDGDLVRIPEGAWRLSCPTVPTGTLVPSGTATWMRFRASQDEEHVSVTLFRGGRSLELGERTHHYLLMLLARQRLSDAARAFDAHSLGWVDSDQLACMLGLDKSHLNIQVFRLRKQFEDAVSQGLIGHDFIERRRGGVRLGNVAIEVFRGSQLEGSWEPDARAEGLATLTAG